MKVGKKKISVKLTYYKKVNASKKNKKGPKRKEPSDETLENQFANVKITARRKLTEKVKRKGEAAAERRQRKSGSMSNHKRFISSRHNYVRYQSEGSEADQPVEESDSSEDEVAPRNTIGDVPFKFYEDEEHTGYDITGKKITKKERQNKLDSFLATADDSKNWRKIYDAYNDEEVELPKEEANMIRRLLQGRAPHKDFDPCAPYVDWFKYEDADHPMSSGPEPKRRFVPSKWEAKKIVKYARAIREGRITLEKPEEGKRWYDLWGDFSAAETSYHLANVRAPGVKLLGHKASTNPPLEYIPTEEEINSYLLMDEEDRPDFIPRRYTSWREIPPYKNAVRDIFERCLDLLLCPRVRKKRINIDPQTLISKLPSGEDLKPYPDKLYLDYRGHSGAVMSISLEPSGQWLASGSIDGTARLWEVETGRCVKLWELGEAVQCVAWNPLSDRPILAVSAGQDVFLFNTGLGDEETQGKVNELLTAAEAPDSILSWVEDERYGGIKLSHFKKVSSLVWHRRGDYFSTLMPADSRAVLVHRLSNKFTQRFPLDLRGLAVAAVFHPSRSVVFVATKKHVRAYDLVKMESTKKLETGLREVSSIAVHPAGDNLIVGSKEGKLIWFDMNLSSKPYKRMNAHSKGITNVAFHQRYPLFASCSDDSTAHVFHGMVYSDLDMDPLIVPLKILRGHTISNGRGVMDCKFHPRQPWLFTAGSDSVISLYCH